MFPHMQIGLSYESYIEKSMQLEHININFIVNMKKKYISYCLYGMFPLQSTPSGMNIYDILMAKGSEYMLTRSWL